MKSSFYDSISLGFPYAKRKIFKSAYSISRISYIGTYLLKNGYFFFFLKISMKVSERSYSFIYKYVDMSLSKMIRETSSYIFFFIQKI